MLAINEISGKKHKLQEGVKAAGCLKVYWRKHKFYLNICVFMIYIYESQDLNLFIKDIFCFHIAKMLPFICYKVVFLI